MTSESDLRARTTRDVLEDHLELRRADDLETDISRNYHPDVTCLSLTAARTGHDGVREMAVELQRDSGTGMLVWSATCPQGAIRDGTDSFMVRDGYITVQTVHYHVRS